MKQNLLELIHDAEHRHVAIGHFNIATLEQLKGIVRAAKTLRVPVIIGVSEGEREFIGAAEAAALIHSLQKDGFPIFLNADHTHSLQKIQEAADVGFDAVLFDGGKLLFEENVKQTKQAVEIVRKISEGWGQKILVEGELGYIGGSSEILEKIPEGAAQGEMLTKPEDAFRFVKETGVDLLAPAVGNIHGMLKNAPNPRLDISRIKAIREAAGIPLVLHGGSGISDEDFISAIDAGVSVIHISTEIRVAWRRGIENAVHEVESIAPYKLMENVVSAVQDAVQKRLKLFSKM